MRAPTTNEEKEREHTHKEEQKKTSKYKTHTNNNTNTGCRDASMLHAVQRYATPPSRHDDDRTDKEYQQEV